MPQTAGLCCIPNWQPQKETLPEQLNCDGWWDNLPRKDLKYGRLADELVKTKCEDITSKYQPNATVDAVSGDSLSWMFGNYVL